MLHGSRFCLLGWADGGRRTHASSGWWKLSKTEPCSAGKWGLRGNHKTGLLIRQWCSLVYLCNRSLLFLFSSASITGFIVPAIPIQSSILYYISYDLPDHRCESSVHEQMKLLCLQTISNNCTVLACESVDLDLIKAWKRPIAHVFCMEKRLL